MGWPAVCQIVICNIFLDVTILIAIETSLNYRVNCGRSFAETVRFVDRKKAPYLVQVSGPSLNACRVIVYFVHIFPNFRYYGNKGWSESFSLAQLNRPTPKTPHRERIAHILSPLQAVLWSILCLYFSLFVSCQQEYVGLAKDWMTTFK